MSKKVTHGENIEKLDRLISEALEKASIAFDGHPWDTRNEAARTLRELFEARKAAADTITVQ